MTGLSTELIKFANPALDRVEQSILIQVIDKIFCDLTDGHSCSSLDDLVRELMLSDTELRKLLFKSHLVGDYIAGSKIIKAKPLTIYHNSGNDLLYLSKYLEYELGIARKVVALNTSYPFASNPNFIEYINQLNDISVKHNLPNSEQLAAIKNGVLQRLSIITGGPGTGKTTTVILLLWVLMKLYDNQQLNIKICAPTGKAANRVRESILGNIKRFQNDGFEIDCKDFDLFLSDNNSFTTIHKLLGYKVGSTYFQYNANNQLPVDILIVDESSMIGLPLFSKLLAAIDSSIVKNIIFLGDKNQLSSVEEGYVFASLVNYGVSASEIKRGQQLSQPDLFNPVIPEPVASTYQVSALLSSNRNSGDISKLANAVLDLDLSLIKTLLKTSSVTAIKPLAVQMLIHELFAHDAALMGYAKFIASQSYDFCGVDDLFRALNQHIILCITNNGRFGVDNLNLLVEKKLKQLLGINSIWYNGRPVLILSNDYSLGIFNGDVGVCRIKNEQPYIIFANGRELIPEVLPAYQLAYVLTIHKSQGSEYQEVSIVLPELSDSANIASRELIYTAITRAKSKVQIYAKLEVLEEIILTKLERNSGLESMLKLQC